MELKTSWAILLGVKAGLNKRSLGHKILKKEFQSQARCLRKLKNFVFKQATVVDNWKHHKSPFRILILQFSIISPGFVIYFYCLQTIENYNSVNKQNKTTVQLLQPKRTSQCWLSTWPWSEDTASTWATPSSSRWAWPSWATSPSSWTWTTFPTGLPNSLPWSYLGWETRLALEISNCDSYKAKLFERSLKNFFNDKSTIPAV